MSRYLFVVKSTNYTTNFYIFLKKLTKVSIESAIKNIRYNAKEGDFGKENFTIINIIKLDD